MNRSDLIWRHLIEAGLAGEPQHYRDISALIGCSLGLISRISQEIESRGAASITKHGILVTDPLRAVTIWACRTKRENDLIASRSVGAEPREILAVLPRGVVPTAFAAWKIPPGDYRTVHLYSDGVAQVEALMERLPPAAGRGPENLVVYRKDPLFERYAAASDGAPARSQIYCDTFRTNEVTSPAFIDDLNRAFREMVFRRLDGEDRGRVLPTPSARRKRPGFGSSLGNSG